MGSVHRFDGFNGSRRFYGSIGAVMGIRPVGRTFEPANP